MNSPRVLLSLLLFVILFFPSLQIPIHQFEDVDLFVNSPLEPGEPILIPDVGQFLWITKDGTEFSVLDNQYGFAVTGIGSRPQVTVSGQIRSGERLAPQRKWPSHPTVKSFIVNIPINYPPIETASRLRIPPEVWQQQLSADEKQRAAERELMQSLLAEVNAEIDTSCWQRPVNNIITSRFGAPRTLPDGRRYYHTGMDYRARIGAPIYAAGSGKVVYADFMIVPGNLVVLDHGGGLYSRYAHLSEIKVKLGDEVEKAQLIGLGGNTGRVTAPHLHWEVLWKGNHADPEMFLEAWRQICDPK